MKLTTLIAPLLLVCQTLATPEDNPPTTVIIEEQEQGHSTTQNICSKKYDWGHAKNKFRICGDNSWGHGGIDVLREINDNRLRVRDIKTGTGNGCDWWITFMARLHYLDSYFERAITEAGGPATTCRTVKSWNEVGEGH